MNKYVQIMNPTIKEAKIYIPAQATYEEHKSLP